VGRVDGRFDRSPLPKRRSPRFPTPSLTQIPFRAGATAVVAMSPSQSGNVGGRRAQHSRGDAKSSNPTMAPSISSSRREVVGGTLRRQELGMTLIASFFRAASRSCLSGRLGFYGVVSYAGSLRRERDGHTAARPSLGASPVSRVPARHESKGVILASCGVPRSRYRAWAYFSGQVHFQSRVCHAGRRIL